MFKMAKLFLPPPLIFTNFHNFLPSLTKNFANRKKAKIGENFLFARKLKLLPTRKWRKISEESIAERKERKTFSLKGNRETPHNLIINLNLVFFLLLLLAPTLTAVTIFP